VSVPREDRAGSILGAEPSKRSIGWICGALAFWALSAWIVVVGLSSIIPQIFWPAQAEAVARAGCRQELRELEHELLANAANDVKNAGQSADPPAFVGWLQDFDERLKNTSAHCAPDEQSAFDELVRVRHALGSFMERFEREEAPRFRELDALLHDEVRGDAP